MSEPERIYEDRRVPVGYRHQCEWAGCGKVFTSKRKARFCSTPCRSAHAMDRDRRARALLDAQEGDENAGAPSGQA